MSTIDVDDLAQIIRQVDGNRYLGAGVLAETILNRLSSSTIIRTVEELKALDQDTVLYTPRRDNPVYAGDFLADICYDRFYADDLPAVVITPADQVRAAQKALEEA